MTPVFTDCSVSVWSDYQNTNNFIIPGWSHSARLKRRVLWRRPERWRAGGTGGSQQQLCVCGGRDQDRKIIHSVQTIQEEGNVRPRVHYCCYWTPGGGRVLLPVVLASGVVAAMLYCQHKVAVPLVTIPANVNSPIHYMETNLGGERDVRMRCRMLSIITSVLALRSTHVTSQDWW